ncbi:MAG: hypothetical protein KDC92_14515, partial [Bacteroidetes bacterium]|nr:hypothetical protein [Bacteroidota bacterium]
ELGVGDISHPVIYNTPDMRTAYRILYLKDKIEPHIANLNQDYPRLSELTKLKKTNKVLNDWAHKTIPSVYFRIDDEYKECPQIIKLLETIDKYN